MKNSGIMKSPKLTVFPRRIRVLNKIGSIDWVIILLGLIALLLVFIIIKLREVIETLMEFQERLGLTATSKPVDFSSKRPVGECTEEELAAITAVLTEILADEKWNIVKLKALR
jgi:hypothetical protein